MKKFIDIINEGSNHPAFADEVADVDAGAPDDVSELHAMFADVFAPLHNLRHRMQIEAVYNLVLDGIPFEDAVGHIAKRDGMHPLTLRSLVVDDYKVLRGSSETYASDIGHALVNNMNRTIRESLDSAVRAHDTMLVERSMKVGAYSSDTGDVLTVLRHPENKKHHMLMNKKGEVVGSIIDDPEVVHQKLTDDGFKGAMMESLNEDESNPLIGQIVEILNRVLDSYSGIDHNADLNAAHEIANTPHITREGVHQIVKDIDTYDPYEGHELSSIDGAVYEIYQLLGL